MDSAILPAFITPKKLRNKNWDNLGEVITLLDLWEERYDELASCKRNGHVYDKIVQEMALQGYFRSSQEVRKKIQNMICKFRREREAPTGWRYYDKVESILRSHNWKEFNEEERGKNKNDDFAHSGAEMHQILYLSAVKEEGASRSGLHDSETPENAQNNETDEEDSCGASSALLSADTESQPATSFMNFSEGDKSNEVSLAKRAASEGSADDSCAKKIKIEGIKLTQQPIIERAFSIPVMQSVLQNGSKAVKIPSDEGLKVKDEIELYTELLASKLRQMDQKTRYVAMNRIDNLLFKMTMDTFDERPRT